MLNLVPAIQAILGQMTELEREYEKRMEPLQRSLDSLREINEVCEVCGGEGKVLRPRACAEGDRPDPNDPSDYVRCDVCRGTGLTHPKRTRKHK